MERLTRPDVKELRLSRCNFVVGASREGLIYHVLAKNNVKVRTSRPVKSNFAGRISQNARSICSTGRSQRDNVRTPKRDRSLVQLSKLIRVGMEVATGLWFEASF